MLDQYQDLIDELLETPKALRELLASRSPGAVPPEALRRIAALRDRDQIVLDRLQRLIRATSPHLRALPAPDQLESAGTTPPSDVTALLDSLDAARGELVSALMNLTLKDWERTATHDDGGIVTLADEVERHVEFDEEQLARVRALLMPARQ